MVCVYCGSKTQVSNSRSQKRNNQVWRRRQCLQCKAIFTTQETTDYATSWLVDTGMGSLQPFSRDKLFLSLYASLKHRKTALSDASALTDTVIRKLIGTAKVSQLLNKAIGQAAQVALNRFDSVASAHYQAFHR